MTETLRFTDNQTGLREKHNVHRELDPNSLATRLEDQKLYRLSENERSVLAETKRHEVVVSAMNAGFNVLRSSARGKESQKIESKKEPVYGFREYSKVLFDLVGMRLILENDAEVDKFVEWAEKTFDPPKDNYAHAGFWKKDLRNESSEDRLANIHTQSDYRAVHLRLPSYFHINGDSFLDFFEVQIVTPEQYEANKRNRVGYEQSKLSLLRGGRREVLDKI